MNSLRQWAVVKAVMIDMERGKGTHNKGRTRTMSRAVCPPRHESRRVAHARNRTVHRPRHESRRVSPTE